MAGRKNKPILSNSGKINHHAMKRRNNIARDLKKFKPVTESDTTKYVRRPKHTKDIDEWDRE